MYSEVTNVEDSHTRVGQPEQLRRELDLDGGSAGAAVQDGDSCGGGAVQLGQDRTGEDIHVTLLSSGGREQKSSNCSLSKC